jgi:hypothetical protein
VSSAELHFANIEQHKHHTTTKQTTKLKMAPPMIDPALFDQLKSRIEEDTSVRKELDQILDDLNQHVSFTQGLLSRIHSTPRAKCQSPSPYL